MTRAKRRWLCRYVRSRTVCAWRDIGVFKTARLIPFSSGDGHGQNKPGRAGGQARGEGGGSRGARAERTADHASQWIPGPPVGHAAGNFTEFRWLLGMPAEFVIHSLRHTMLSWLGESGADAFTIMRIAGHSSVTVSQRYVHPSPELLETAFERLDAMNSSARVVEIASKSNLFNKMGA